MEQLLTQLFGSGLVAQVILWVSVIIGVANAITASFPSVKENVYYNFVMKILNFISLNVKHNKNADAVD
jgi:hypothetical protein